MLQPVLSLWSRSLLSCAVILVVASSFRPVFNPPVLDEFTPFSPAVFGVVQDGELVPTDELTLVAGTQYGWILPVEEGAEAVLWEEMLVLPEAPHRWTNAMMLSDDRTTAFTRRIEAPFEGAVEHFWIMEDGDPVGEYHMMLLRNGTPVGSFTFHVNAPAVRHLPCGGVDRAHLFEE
jgi:hypothetical protein